MQLHEKYRPRSFDDVVGQEKTIAKIKALMKRGLSGRAYWISGPSGGGKSSIARLIAAEVADESCVEEVDASALTVSQLREIERNSHVRGWGKGGRAYIVNEAHGLRKDVIRQLLVMLERIPEHAVWVFSTTNDGQEALFDDYDDASPLLSRCLRFELARRDLARPFAERCKAIAEAEGLDGRDISQYVRLIQKHRQNLRAALQEIESGAMSE